MISKQKTILGLLGSDYEPETNSKIKIGSDSKNELNDVKLPITPIENKNANGIDNSFRTKDFSRKA